jgi:hypothetical protein
MKKFTIHTILFLLLCFTFNFEQVYGQDKKVNEECQTDADCASGRCLTLKSGKKVCGTCTQDRLSTLSDRVESACKDKEEMSGSMSNQGETSMNELQRRIDICKECIAARKDVLSECFSGNPEEGHVKQLDDWQKAYENNISILNDRTSNNTMYYCTKSDYENYQKYIDNYCSKNFQQASEDATRRKMEKGGCSDLESWVKSCQECVDNYNEFKKNAFRGRMSSKREEQLDKYTRNLKEINDAWEYKKSNSLCD